MSEGNNFERELRILTEQLQILQVQQSIDAILINTVGDEQLTTTSQAPQTPVAQQAIEIIETATKEPSETFYTETFTPRINDRVRVLNPKHWQPTRGTIQGFTSDGKLKVYTRNRQTIIRLPKNVVCTHRHHERVNGRTTRW